MDSNNIQKLNISMIAPSSEAYSFLPSRIKISTKPNCEMLFGEFVEEIMSKCFKSTFNELEKSSLDILSALIMSALWKMQIRIS